MTLDNVIYIDNLAKIDLHGQDRLTAKYLINDFVNDLEKQKIEIGVIVHGNGQGILKQMTLETLKENKKVVEYKGFYYNTGCTLIRIKRGRL